MFLPLYDRNPLRVIPLQWVTAALIVICMAVFVGQLGFNDSELSRFQYRYGMTPAVLLQYAKLDPGLVGIPSELTLISSMFLHAGWMHLIGNMAYLWVFGDNIEDAMGHWRFLVFFLVCGALASVAHTLANPDSTAPLIGASGAVSGIMGAYLMLHPKVKILVLAFNRIPVYLPAYALLVGWLALQIYSAHMATEDAVAWWAHIGGFVAGALLILAFKRGDVPLFDSGTEH